MNAPQSQTLAARCFMDPGMRLQGLTDVLG